MKKFNVYKIESGKKELVRENVSMELALAIIKYEKESAGLMNVCEMSPSAACSIDSDDVITYQVVDAEPAYEVRVADKKLAEE